MKNSTPPSKPNSKIRWEKEYDRFLKAANIDQKTLCDRLGVTKGDFRNIKKTQSVPALKRIAKVLGIATWTNLVEKATRGYVCINGTYHAVESTSDVATLANLIIDIQNDWELQRQKFSGPAKVKAHPTYWNLFAREILAKEKMNNPSRTQSSLCRACGCKRSNYTAIINDISGIYTEQICRWLYKDAISAEVKQLSLVEDIDTREQERKLMEDRISLHNQRKPVEASGIITVSVGLDDIKKETEHIITGVNPLLRVLKRIKEIEEAECEDEKTEETSNYIKQIVNRIKESPYHQRIKEKELDKR